VALVTTVGTVGPLSGRPTHIFDVVPEFKTLNHIKKNPTNVMNFFINLL